MRAKLKKEYAKKVAKGEQVELANYNLDGYTLTSLRHTFATHSSMLSKDPLATSRIMGHSTTDITNKVYTHVLRERLQGAVADLNFLGEKLNSDIFGDILLAEDSVTS